ncbi:hypothetical protein UT300012_21380 [Paraclostridium bifermentans]
MNLSKIRYLLLLMTFSYLAVISVGSEIESNQQELLKINHFLSDTKSMRDSTEKRLLLLAKDNAYEYRIAPNVLDKYNKVLQELPANFRELMKVKNLKIGSHGNMKGFQGLYFYKYNVIFIRNGANFENNLRHELGHFLQDEYLFDRVGIPTLEKVFREEKHNYNGDSVGYAQTSMYEYFAECFNDYFVRKDELKINSPKAYKLIEDALNNL